MKIIAVVGAGGKTTHIRRLALDYHAQGKKVLVTTTTHMYREVYTNCSCKESEILYELNTKRICMAGKAVAGHKIAALPQAVFWAVCHSCDVVLIEADGSRHLPVKFPADTEPVIPNRVNEIHVVMGLKAIGKPFSACAQRLELVCAHLGVSAQDLVEPKHLYQLWHLGYERVLRRKYPDAALVFVPGQAESEKEQRIALFLQKLAERRESFMTVQERLDALRQEMAKRKIDIYIIPTSDFHESEYVGDYFKARKYMTGFTGSAGVAVVTADEAGLWTDGRYFIQAERQLQGSGVTLYREGEEGVPTILQFLEEKLPQNGVLGFDGRVINSASAQKYETLVEKKAGQMYVSEDLVDLIWEDRPSLPTDKIWILTEEFSGESVTSKLERIRAIMKEQGAQIHLISSLYDIAWILNLRANDIQNVPVFLSFLLITENDTTLFVRDEILTEEVKHYLEENQIAIRPYDAVYEAVTEIAPEQTVLMDDTIINYRLKTLLPDGVTICNEPDPSDKMKAVKNEIELKNTRLAHLRDGVAFTKFMYWLKKNVGKEKITEYSAACYLDQLRAQQEHFLDLSFDTISAYGPNAAMMHYKAEEDTAAELKPESFLLVDSGGHYLEGTTDITRTIALGEISEKQRLHFTTVCRSNLNLANAKFLYGCSGLNLDILSRGPLWQMGIDYKCGTGHGVGHILNVHEGPNGFRWRVVPERKDSGRLEAGMITTDEPGVYLEGEYGIRTENELICVKAEKNEYGQFMKFENITFAPIDLDAINPEEMSRSERKLLNDYHKNVYEKISPYLTDEEREWLKIYTREI